MKTDTKSGRTTMASCSTNGNQHHQEKMTRWDRITKKHLNSVNVQTTQVRRIFDMQFVSGDHMQQMSGRGEGGGGGPNRSGSGRRVGFLDPALVMDMRHEIIRRNKSRSSPPAAKPIDHHKSLQLERIRSHHKRLEQRYVDQEIDKFRKSLRSPKRTKVVVQLDNYQSEAGSNSTASTHLLKDYKLNSPPESQRLEMQHDDGNDIEQRCFKIDEEVTSSSAPKREYVFDFPDENVENVEEPDDILLDIYRTRVAEIEARGLQEIPSEEINPFDDIVDPRKCVRFEYFFKEIDDAEDNANSEASFADSLDTFPPDQSSGENYKAKEVQPLQLIGKHIDVPVEVSHRAPRVRTTESSTDVVGSSDQDQNLPVLSVTKINTEQAADPSMSVTMIPKRTGEVPMAKNEIIAELFRHSQNDAPAMDNRDLLSRYFERWLHHATAVRIARDSDGRNESRQHKINIFLQTVRQEKQRQCEGSDKKVAATVPSNVVLKQKLNSKLKMQRDIIELQNLKLERQERMIAELKLNRLCEETRQSRAAAKQELRNVIRHGNAKLRTTARCVQLVGNLREDDDESAADEFARLQARGVPKFLVDMQMRAIERNARHQEARDRRERLEREKEEQRLATEAAKLKQDEEAKRQRIEELREKRKLERLQRQQKEEERVRYLDNMHKAAAFNRRRLLQRYGMDRFHALIKLKRKNERKMQMFRVFIVLRAAFGAWRRYVESVWADRKRQADEHRRLQLLRWGMNGWKRYQALQTSKLLVAIDWHDMRLTERMFRRWDNYTRHQRCIEEVKMRQAEAHYNWHLKWRVIVHWQRLHAILQLERETDQRRQKWRLKIWELLPDYQPADADAGAARLRRSDENNTKIN